MVVAKDNSKNYETKTEMGGSKTKMFLPITADHSKFQSFKVGVNYAAGIHWILPFDSYGIEI